MRCGGAIPQCRGCPCNCKRRARYARARCSNRAATGSSRSGKAWIEPTTREPGDLPALSLMPWHQGVAGARISPFERRTVRPGPQAMSAQGRTGSASVRPPAFRAAVRACARRPRSASSQTARGDYSMKKTVFVCLAGVRRQRHVCRACVRPERSDPADARSPGQRRSSSPAHDPVTGNGGATTYRRPITLITERRDAVNGQYAHRVRRVARRAGGRGQSLDRRTDRCPHPRHRGQSRAGADRRDRGVRPVPGPVSISAR